MKKLFTKLKSKKGFTLVESVVAIAILAIASMIFATFLATSNRMTMLTLQNEKDFQILQEALSTGKYEGVQITVIETKEDGSKISFDIVFDESTKIEVTGKYVIVENPATEQHIVLFIGDRKLEQPTQKPSPTP